ncbi:MAG: ATP-binding cassette domain-containing protein, partial [Candidatus Izimaplasma sp.]|nr:ATP-binding cassette domain-containing protein [Candidatus Izimaplasma bacterium]
MAELRFSSLDKVYDNGVQAVFDFSLKVRDKEFIVFVGPSGCGKSTTLRMVAGLEEITAGELYIDDILVNDVAPKDRNIAMVFQSYALYPHMTVYDNMAFGLKLRKMAKDEIERRVQNAADVLGLTAYLDRKPKALSGGQRQRVAIARTIIVNPTIILADEPTGALDSTTGIEIMKLLQKFSAGRIIIMVTHDEDLAYKNTTRVIRLHDGDVISDEIIKDKNSITRDTTNRLLSYETKVSRRLKKRLLKQFPEIEEQLIVGKKCYVPLQRKYIANNPIFTRKIARENFKQKIKINRRILLSFIVSISLLLVVNIVMKNISAYNFNLFEINNNYVQYLVTDYDDATTTIAALEATENVDEVLLYYEHYVQEMYLVSDDGYLAITSNVSTVNKGVFSPKMVTLPDKSSNFYL